MSTSYLDAVDAIFSKFEIAWLDGRVQTLTQNSPIIVWQGVEPENKPTGFWVRVSQQTVLNKQRSFGHTGCKRYRTVGNIFVQIFCPKSKADGFEIGRKLADIAQKIFTSNIDPENIWFRNPRIKELPEERDTYRFNVIAEYEYDELV